MKFYYYILYKVFRFRKAISIKGLDYKGEAEIDAAGLIICPLIIWSLVGPILIMHGLKAAGLVYNAASHKFYFATTTSLEWGLIWWGNYRLLKSSRWQLYTAKFAAYSKGKRLLGSLVVFSVLVGLFISSLFLLQYQYMFH